MRVNFPVTVHLLLIREDQILLIRRFRTGYMDGHYSLPAGHLNGNETVRTAAIREAREEIGVEVLQRDLIFAGVFHRNEDEERVDFFFKLQGWVGEPFNAEPEKCDCLIWVDIHALPDTTIPYIRKAISNFQAGISYDEIGWK